ncbi:MAG TPA: transporter [Saprospiraceae bacterium]|nr:transporter [Saprospiraceae bacterium]
MKTTLLLACLLLLFGPIWLNGQGCVAIRGNAACGGNMANNFNFLPGQFTAQLGFRNFKSFRHFRGEVEEHHRLEAGTEVINHSSFLDFALTYNISDRLYANAILPLVFHRRSSMYEHGGNPPNGLGERHETAASGLADIRLGLGYWLFDPSQHNFNYAIGIGIKLPTGQYDYSDTFYNQGDDRDQDRVTVVDQSIQPGDGGTGFTLDLQGFHPISHRFTLSTNLFYLFNFQETNGVLTRSGRSEFSCPDQFAARLGLSYNTMQGWNFYLGGRAEGVPANDILGGSAGYRRPGYAISAEPGIGFFKGNYSIFASVPIALYRNRIRSYEDIQRTEQTGQYRHGDAAFADYLINLGITYTFGGHQSMDIDTPGFKEVGSTKIGKR